VLSAIATEGVLRSRGFNDCKTSFRLLRPGRLIKDPARYLRLFLGRCLLLANFPPRRRERPRAHKPDEHVARALSGRLAGVTHAAEVAEHLALLGAHRLACRLEARAAAAKVARVREQQVERELAVVRVRQEPVVAACFELEDESILQPEVAWQRDQGRV
jgi:hypothetical protein